MATVIYNIELFNNANSIEELKSNIENYIENYCGHVVEDRSEADKWFAEISKSEPVTHWSDSQTDHLTLLSDDTPVYVKIDEISQDGDTDNYCYIVNVEEE